MLILIVLIAVVALVAGVFAYVLTGLLLSSFSENFGNDCPGFSPAGTALPRILSLATNNTMAASKAAARTIHKSVITYRIPNLDLQHNFTHVLAALH